MKSSSKHICILVKGHGKPGQAGKTLLRTLIVLLLVLGLRLPVTSAESESDDRIWRDVPEKSLNLPTDGKNLVSPHRRVNLDPTLLREVLNRAPKEVLPGTLVSSVTLSLPMPDGSYSQFQIEESSIMESALAEKFPEIKTYRGKGLDNPSATVRFDWTPAGFHAMILSEGETVIIDPYQRGDTHHYISYYKKDIKKSGQPFRCVTKDTVRVQEDSFRLSLAASLSGSTLRTYRLAVAATGEYTQFWGGTVSGALSRIATTINRVTGIYERELAIRLILVANETSIIYMDPAKDPYTNNNLPSMMDQNQSNLNQVIGSANYDIGHVFGVGNGGGRAGIAGVCNNGQKAKGATVSIFPAGEIFDVDYVSHEMGHQFGANHSFNGTTGSCGGGRTSSTAYEPASGSTIMAYAGICGAENLQINSHDYFHTISTSQIITFTTGGGLGNTCDVENPTGNLPPTVDAGLNYTIPKSTPFILTATGSDPNGDALTYSWEEFDLGSASPPNTDNGNRPIFRSFPPVTIPLRIFPQMSDIVLNRTLLGESYPITNRTMTFRVTARDNRPGGGGLNLDFMSVAVTTSAGPFTVTSPNTAVTWPGNSMQTVTWNVANTSAAPVNATHVNILLSVNGGYTYPIALASNTPNDGSQSILVPNNTMPYARVKVEAVDNIFFDISNSDFNITCTPVGAPSLVTPPNGSTSVSTSPTLDWTDVTGTGSYCVQVATNPGFSNIIRERCFSIPSTWTVTPPLNNNTTYYWRAGTGACSQTTYSASWSFVTSGSQTPFWGTPFALPGIIQAEDFDNGGEGIAYHDADSGNLGGQYRSTGVDITATADTGGGYIVGWTNAGEWLEYTVNVPTAGTYTLEARVASAISGSKFHVELNGYAQTETIAVPYTGGWDTWQTVRTYIYFSAGQQTMRIAVDTGGFNLNHIRIAQYQGYLDTADCQYIAGWAWDRGQPNTPINVDIYSDGVLISVFPANAFRQDLLNAGIGNGYHGFFFPVPANLKNSQPHSISVRFSGTNDQLIGSPKTITCSGPSISIMWIKPAEKSWGPPGSLTAAGYALNGSGTVQLVWRNATINGPWNVVGYQATPGPGGDWSNSIPAPTNKCHVYQAYANYNGVSSSVFTYNGVTAGDCTETARVIWIQPQPLAGFGPPGSLVVAGEARNAPAGTRVQMFWRNLTINGPWNAEPYQPVPDANGIWYHSIPNANYFQQYAVYVRYDAITSGTCNYAGNNNITWCP